jgi:hypothetical protein
MHLSDKFPTITNIAYYFIYFMEVYRIQPTNIKLLPYLQYQSLSMSCNSSAILTVQGVLMHSTICHSYQEGRNSNAQQNQYSSFNNLR